MDNQKKKALIALKKARTSIDKVIRMIENKDYCIDIMQQILAVDGLLKSANDKLFENHLETCFKSGMKTNNENVRIKLVSEVINTLKLKNK